ncbi:MAG: sulfite exporter TauE/SafE family protein [Deltaproteobacteria bacterium]|nr:sulfite exporter TauE/SafE family protein [Deltaproteobacteria bacterium]
MSLIEFFLFIGVGCGVGFLAGLFGVGGGFILVPVLIFSYEHSNLSPSILTHVAIGTSLLVVVFSGMTSAYQHRKQGNVDWRAVFMIGFSSCITALATTRVAAALSGRHLRIAFAIIIIIAAVRMLTESASKAQKKLNLSSRPSTQGLIGVGLAAGVVSALAGIGGGLVTIPVMYQILRMPLKLAIGTSSAAIVITALFSVTGYIVNGMGHPDIPAGNFGFVDFQRGMALAIGTMLLARVGAKVSFKTHPFLLRKLFALFVILMAIYLLVK